MNIFSLTTHLQQKHDKISILCTCHPWPLPPLSHHHPGQRITHVSLASKRYQGDHMNVRVGAVPSVGSPSCSPLGQSLPSWTSSVEWTAYLLRDHMSYSQELIGQELKCWTLKTDHLLEPALTLWLSRWLMLREEPDPQKKHTGVCTKKKTGIFIFHCQLQGKNFFYRLHEGFFFFINCMYSWL